MDAVLRVDKLKVHGLPPMSFEVAGGQCLAVEGPSGSGKSLLLRAIADLDPAEGRVFLDGAERCEMTGPQWRMLVRYVAAEPGWWLDIAVSHFADTARAATKAAALGLEQRQLDQQIASLSTGERQRLALIRALADDPRAVLFDEPTSSLDTGSAALVEEMIKFEILSGRCVVLVSHDTALLDRLASRRLKLGEMTRLSAAAMPAAEAAS